MVSLSRKSPHRRLIAIQKQIYLSLQDESRRLLGETPRSIQKYEKQFHQDFKRLTRTFSPVSQNKLVQKILATPLTLVGDFHTFFQAQRTALRILRSAVQAGPKFDWLLGLEMVGSPHQKELDRYSQGKIGLGKLFEIIRYDDEWGFPWRHYAQILEWARDNKVGLVALNRPKELIEFWPSRDEDLSLRDEWAAGVIVDRLSGPRRKKTRMIALYGELHLGTNHLPTGIKKISQRFEGGPLEPLVIHQNQDLLYWKLAKRGTELKTQILKLNDPKNFCVISTTPWTKLQSLVNWAENPERAPDPLQNTILENEPDWEQEFQTDFLDLIQRDGRIICKFLDLYPPSYESLNIKTWNDLEFLESAPLSNKLLPIEKKIYRLYLQNNWRLFIRKLETAYLASAGDNACAEMAAFHIFHHRYHAPQHKSPPLSETERYCKNTLEHAFGFFGSLILNPRRKCDLIEDHQDRIALLKKGAPPAFRTEKAAREHCLRVLRALNRGRTLPPLGQVEVWAPSARYLGHFLGRALYFATLVDGPARSRVSLEEAKEILLAPRTVSKDFFTNRIKALMKALPALPSGSKEEQF